VAALPSVSDHDFCETRPAGEPAVDLQDMEADDGESACPVPVSAQAAVPFLRQVQDRF
jgi:hypothetical protein